MPLLVILLLTLGLLSACSSNKLIDNQTSIDTIHSTSLDFSTHINEWRCFPFDENSPINEATIARPISPDGNLWHRLQDGLQLEYIDNREVNTQLRWYIKNSAYLLRVQQRAERYLYHIIDALEQHDLPLDIALLPIVESAYEPFSYSHGQASGLWQFIPTTGNRFKLRQDWWYDGRRDTADSSLAAIQYLSYLYRFFDGDWLLALAAYNSGEGTVQRAVRANQRANKPTDFWHLNLPAETRAYVPKMIALAEIFKNPERYEVELAYLANKPYFASVTLDSQMDLMQAAELAGISIDELYYLNPGYNRWATPPGKGYSLKLPVETIAAFKEALDRLPQDQRISWQRHIIKKGESLNSIAKKYQSNIEWIKEINQLTSHVIVAGHTLMIPVASANLSKYRHSESQRLANKQSTAPGNNFQKVNYTVQSGDSFWSIAKRHNVKVENLARWNNKSPKDTLRIGESLVIWSSSGFPIRQGKVNKINYRVRQGDSLAKIANRFHVSVNDIIRWNQLDATRYLQPGQTLSLMVNIINTSGQ